MKNEKSIDRMAISNVVIRTKILVDGRKRRRDESWIERTFPPLRASETIVLVFLAVLTIVITTSDLHFSRGITFPAGECKFERRAGSGREGGRGIGGIQEEDNLYRGERV